MFESGIEIVVMKDDKNEVMKNKSEDGFPFVFYVKCAACGQVCHKTTEEFVYGGPYNGKMFELRERLGEKGANWSSFPSDESVTGDGLVCPNCDVPYADITKHLVFDGKGERRVSRGFIKRFVKGEAFDATTTKRKK